MFYALSRFRYSRLTIVLVIAALVAMGTYAAAASNTFSGTPEVGGGSVAVTGFVISNILFDLNDTDPDQLDSVSFTTDVAATEVSVILTKAGPISSAGIACTFVIVQTSWTCDLTAETTTATELIDLGVFAAN